MRARPCYLTALKAGYRYAPFLRGAMGRFNYFASRFTGVFLRVVPAAALGAHRTIQFGFPCFYLLTFSRHVDSAQVYRNKAAVGQAVRESGLERGQVFTSAFPFRFFGFCTSL